MRIRIILAVKLLFVLGCLFLAAGLAAAYDNPYHPRPWFDPIKAAPALVSVSMILAGFSFAAVILILRSRLSGELEESDRYKIVWDYLPITFFLSLWGFLLTAIDFVLISGEPYLDPISVSIEFLGISGILISMSFMFWGLSTFSEMCLPLEVSKFSRVMLWCIVFTSLLTIVAAAFDPILIFSQPEKLKPEIPLLSIAIICCAGFLPFIIGFIIKLCCEQKAKKIIKSNIRIVFYLSILFMTILSIWASYCGFIGESYSISLYSTGLIIAIYSGISTILLLSLPILAYET